MENYQLTMQDYMDYKESLQRELNNVVNGFIKTGYYLKKIRDTEAYKNDGYSTIFEFAEKEYGITRTVASRFMSINDKFSESGYSLELMEQYKGLGSSRLSEMLTLPEEDHAMVSNITKIEDIRALKRFEREEHKEKSTLDELIKELFVGQEKQLEAVMLNSSIKDVAEIINPSGNKSFRHKMDFMMLHEYKNGIDIKNFITGMCHLTWEEFVEECKKVFTYVPEAEGTVYEQNYPKKETEPEQLEKQAETNEVAKVEKVLERTKFNPPEKKQEVEPEQSPKETKTVCDTAQNNENIKMEQDLEENTTDKNETEKEEAEPKKEEIEIQETDLNIKADTTSEVLEGEVEEKTVWRNENGIPMLKVAEKYYKDISDGRKRFSIRRNDRNFKVGDKYELCCTNGIRILSSPHYLIEITYVLEDFIGLADGYIAFGYKVLNE